METTLIQEELKEEEGIEKESVEDSWVSSAGGRVGIVEADHSGGRLLRCRHRVYFLVECSREIKNKHTCRTKNENRKAKKKRNRLKRHGV